MKQRTGPWWPAFGALVVLALTCGCPATPRLPQPPSVSRTRVVKKQSLEELISRIRQNVMGWLTLDAVCDVSITSPLINLPGNRVDLTNGSITVERINGRIHISFPAEPGGSLRVIGDGSSFAVDILDRSYRGKYGDPVTGQSDRVHLQPEDLLAVLDPSGLFLRTRQVLAQGPRFSLIYSLAFVEEPQPHVRMVSSVSIDRAGEEHMVVTTYDPDGSVRATMRVLSVATLSGLRNVPVEIPSRIAILYPEDPTTIRIDVRKIRLNGKLAPGLFELPD